MLGTWAGSGLCGFPEWPPLSSSDIGPVGLGTWLQGHPGAGVPGTSGLSVTSYPYSSKQVPDMITMVPLGE